MFKAQQRQINDLLKGSVFEIPRNQRQYVWRQQNWKDLLEDMQFILAANSEEKRHFIGSIVLKEEPARNGLSAYTIIDGQQRTITVVLFLAAILQLMKEREMKNDFAGSISLLLESDLKNNKVPVIESEYHLAISKIIKAVCKTTPTSFHKMLAGIITSNNRKVDKCIGDCITYFYGELHEKDNDYLLKIRDAIINTNYVEISATTDEDSYTIFEILNARGQSLEDHELLKNYIMRYILPISKVDEVKQEWSEIIDRGMGKSVTRFFRHYTSHRYRVSNKDSIFKVIQANNKAVDINELYADILLKASFYQRMLNPSLNGENANCTAKEFEVFSYLKSKKSELFRPFLLSLIDKNYKQIVDTTLYDSTLNFLKDFFICYNIISEDNSNKLSDTVWKYAPLVENDYSEEHIAKFISSLQSKLPQEGQFLKIFQNIGWSNHQGFYNDEHKKRQVQAVLEIVESIKLGHPVVESFTIEHVLPDSQSPENALIGNLLPLERNLNDNCKDKPLADKIHIYKQSQFKTTREFAERYENKTFDPQKRAEFMAKMVWSKVNSYSRGK